MKKIAGEIKLKKLKKLKKKLTVKTLSFIMAAGLLLIIVPFMVLAEGREDIGLNRPGDFKLLRNYFQVTVVTLERDSESVPKIVAEDVDGVGAISYKWQAYSVRDEKYVNVQGGQSIRMTVALAEKYLCADGKSYFRCTATDEEGTLYVSRVLTVVLPQEQTDDSDTTTQPENGETIATIELLEPTEPDETTTAPEESATTEPSEPTTQPAETTTQPTETTTEPAKETTTRTTAPTQPADDGGKQDDEPEDVDPIDGKLLDPITDDEGEDDSAPIRGMLLVPLGDAVNYTVEYYVEKANESGYELFDTRTESAEPGSVIDYTNGHKLYSGSDVNENAYYELSTHPTTYPSDSNVVRILYNRKRYTFTFKYPSYPFRMTNMVYTDGNGQPHTIGHGSTYSFEAKYGQYIESKWPENDAITTKPKNGTITFYFTQVKDKTNNNALIEGNPRYVTNSLVANGQNHTLEFVWSRTNPSTTNENKHIYKCYLQEADNNYPSTPYRTYYYPTALSSYPTFEGYGNPQVTQSTSGYWFNRKTTYTLKYPRASYELKIVKPDGTTDVISKKYKDDISGVPNSYPSDYTWFSDPNYTAPYSWTGAKMPYENLTVFAKGTSATHTLLVISKRAGTETTLTEKNEQVAAGDTISAPSLTGWTGYHFTGWYSDAALTDSITFPTTMPNDDLTVYAKWEVDTHTLTVKYVDDRGTEETKGTTTHDYGATVTEPAKSWTGHTFVNWTYADGTAVTWPVTMDGDKTVVAHWTLNQHTLTVYKNNEDDPSSYTIPDVDYGTILSTIVTTPTRTGYTFVAWHTDSSLSVASKINDFSAYTMPDEDHAIYAEWQVNRHILTVHNNNGDAVIPTPNVAFGTYLSTIVTTPTRTGYRFVAWHTDSGLSPASKIADFSAYTMPDEDHAIYAEWEKESYILTVKYRDEDLNTYFGEDTTYSIVYGDRIFDTVPSEPDVEGYSFVRWLNEYLNTEPELTSGTKTMPAKPLTIVALMERLYYSVTVKQYEDASSAIATERVAYGDPVGTDYSAYETRPGYHFDGWYYKDSDNNEQSFVFGTTPVRSDMVVYGKWSEITLTITNAGNDNVFSINGSGLNLRVFIPAGGSVTVRQIPYGSYTINGEGWDYENTFTAVSMTIDDTTGSPLHFAFTAEPGVTAKDPFHWLRGACGITNPFDPVPES